MPAFADLPLSEETKRGLKDSGYTVPTEIQVQTLEHAVRGRDVLAAAKTGSGKTLAFLIPVLERLHALSWSPVDGLGALLITPTRELAYQIFEVLRKVGRHHGLSGGLVIGGKDLRHERTRLDSCNVIVCTPGRILQHMDENPCFHWDQLQLLVLDEADRILDLGFAQTMNAVIENLPMQRQTLLFSATQTKKVQDLARLSLKKPKYVSAHELSATLTPDTLTQSFLVCELDQKLDLLWSFLRSHRSQKILVFFASCKQVKFAFELLTRLRPPGPLLALYGSLHQLRRMRIYDEFCRKQNAVLLSTDVAARGLDFPAVQWVLQLDCPEHVNTYIHRVGRTARLDQEGHSLLVLLPSEREAMLARLQEKKIPISQLFLPDQHGASIRRKAESLCARDVELKDSAQRAFKAYFKSVHLMRDKQVFNVRALDKDRYAASLGLVVTPRVRFLEKSSSGATTAVTTDPAPATNPKVKKFDNSDDDGGNSEKAGKPQKAQKQVRLLGGVSSDDEDEDDADDLFTKKSTWKPDDPDSRTPAIPVIDTTAAQSKKKKKNEMVTKAAVAKKLAKKKIRANQKIVFDEEGEPIADLALQQTSDKLKQLEERQVSGIDIELAKQIMKDEDRVDKLIHRQVIKDKKLKKKLKEKEEKRKQDYADKRAVLLAGDHDASDEEQDLDEITSRYIDELPDPDRVRADHDDEDDEDDEVEAAEDDEDRSRDEEEDEEGGEMSECEGQEMLGCKEGSRSGKRKARELASSSSEDDDHVEANEWQVPDQESLALHLLSK